MPSVEELKRRLAHTLKARQIDAALGALSALARKQPHEPSWPRRAARLHHATRNSQAELVALRRALELEIDQGLVLDAIASCKAILEILPEDEQTLECLDLLYLNGPPGSGEDSNGQGSGSEASELDPRGESTDAPLDSIRLSDLVPGARSVQLADALPGHVNEIPVDSLQANDSDAVVDLRLEEISSDEGLRDLAAAQVASLPEPARRAPNAGGGHKSGERGSTLRRELANVPLFGDLDPASLHTLIRKVRAVALEAGQVLFRQGDPANSLYVVVEGAVVPIAEGEPRRKLAVLERGAFFGEIGLMTKQPRNATIEALVDTKLLAIDRRVMWELIGRQPSVAKSLLRFLRSRLVDRQIRTNLFFAAFAHAEREAVARQFRIFEVTDGARIVAQGKPPEGLFVVLSGVLSLRDRKRNKRIGELHPGDVFGGLSLLEGQDSACDVVAQGKCWLVVLGEGRFRRIVEANPRLERVLRRLSLESGRDAALPSMAAL